MQLDNIKEKLKLEESKVARNALLVFSAKRNHGVTIPQGWIREHYDNGKLVSRERWYPQSIIEYHTTTANIFKKHKPSLQLITNYIKGGEIYKENRKKVLIKRRAETPIKPPPDKKFVFLFDIGDKILTKLQMKQKEIQ